MTELFHNFGVEWKLLLAQAINFFVLLFILRKFLYKPILKMLASRREKIETGLKKAKEAEEQLQKIDAMKDEVLSAAHQRELEILKGAEIQAHAKEKEMIEQARLKAERIIAEGKEKIEEEHYKLSDAFFGEAGELLRSALVKVFEKSPEKFEEKLIEKSLQELKSARINE